jgi:hypothetical protein
MVCERSSRETVGLDSVSPRRGASNCTADDAPGGRQSGSQS